ncbi:MAG: YbaK/EbsC family protein [Chloroflexota bacterium]
MHDAAGTNPTLSGEPSPPSASAQRVQHALDQFGLGHRVIELPDSTRSAQEAAQAVGCSVGQIAKSLVFRAAASGRPILVIASGSHRVNEARLSALLGEPIEKADADFVRQHTGFAIRGVPPVCHPQRLTTVLDEALFAYSEIWPATDTPRAVFRLTPSELQAETGGQAAALT